MGCNCRGCCVGDIALMVMMIVEVPGGVTMGGGVVVTLPLPQPTAFIAAHKKNAAKRPLHAQRPAWDARANFQVFTEVASNSRTRARRRSTRIPAGGRKGVGIQAGIVARPSVD